MTGPAGTQLGTRPDADFLPPSRRRADGATLAGLFVLSLLLVPAELILRGLPLSFAPSDVVALGLALCWFCAHFTTTLGMAKGRNPVRTAVFLYAAAMLLTFGYATAGYLPLDELRLADHAAVLVVATVGVALAVCDGVRGVERLDVVLKTLVVAGALVSVVGAFQFLLNLDLTRYLVLPGLRFGTEYAFVIERNQLRRVAATTGHPIEFGVLCAMILPIGAHYGFQAARRGVRAWPWWLATALCGAGLMFSVSRSAALGLVAAGLVLIAGWPARRRLGAAAVALAFLVAVKLMVPGLLGTFYSLFANVGSDNSIRYRTHDYEAAANEIARHPWLGHGIGTWYAPKHQIFDNQYILTTVEAGLVGVAAFVLLFVVAIATALRARRRGTDPDVRELGLVLAASLVVPVVGAATFDLLTFHMVTGVTFLLIGAVGALWRAAVTP